MSHRMALLESIDVQRKAFDKTAAYENLDRHRQTAVSLLTDGHVRKALDVSSASAAELERYGNHSFGWSLLTARRLIEAGVPLIQVNLGNNETWDTHGNAFPHLKEKLFPPTDQALSALLDDLAASGRLELTLIVVGSEFGRTPKVTTLAGVYKGPGRDHWGSAQTLLMAGGGVRGGVVVGATDRFGGHPIRDPYRPENLSAHIFRSLGLPPTTEYHDELNRPHALYYGEPILPLWS
ncbi:MAG: DUF1501 domain-containing protein [Planctomycetia bacterium]